ncbi:MAG: hypothetical protein EOO24_42130, partial [Comamonadaceae bacterium]
MGQGATLISRRTALAATAALLAGCEPPLAIGGGFVAGASAERGHRLRAMADWPNPATSRRAQVVIAGGGIAGLAAAITTCARREV